MNSIINYRLLLPLVTSLVIFPVSLQTGCSDWYHTANSPQVVEVIPHAGTRQTPTVIYSLTQVFLVRFDQSIIANSGSITFGDWTFQPEATDKPDTLTWNRCRRPLRMPENLVPLIIENFESVDGETQRERFEGWYTIHGVDLYDIDPPEIVEYHPTGQDVDPESIKEIRVVFDRPMTNMEIQISPPINGRARFDSNDILCFGVARWVISDTVQLRYATDYRIVVRVTDRFGQHAQLTLEFSTRAKP